MISHNPAVERESFLRRPLRLLASVLSLRYLLLRVFTGGFTVFAGFLQTFVFARVLTPQDFSIFILIGTFGVSLWLFDLGAAKIVFVRQRSRNLAQSSDGEVTAQSSAVVLLYGLMVLTGTAICFAVLALAPSVTLWQAAEFSLFFSFSALNLVWFLLRNVSNAVDEFIRFEMLDVVRRIAVIGVMLALLIGLPLWAFLLVVNLSWAAALTFCVVHLVRKGALTRCVAGFWTTLTVFWRTNRGHLLRSGNFMIGELAVYNFPYLVVPLAYGLGGPTIILDTVFKVLRGTTLIYDAGLDPLIPRQTHAFAEHDAPMLKKATLAATILCFIPTVIICGVLLFAGDRLFALLLGHVATVPRAATLILVVLLLANMAQKVATGLLQHTGFFRQIARVATFLVVGMAAMTTIVYAAGLDFTGFLGGYTVVFIAGAVLYIGDMVRGPFRIAATPKVAPR
jgi:O-antigen/teichoic acid export membrane protein